MSVCLSFREFKEKRWNVIIISVNSLIKRVVIKCLYSTYDMHKFIDIVYLVFSYNNMFRLSRSAIIR
jgi:hypothetical protein